MAAYRSAQRLCGNSHVPGLCIGTEYLRVHNTEMALHFIDAARAQCPSDPLAYNELGVAHYKSARYAEALRMFQQADALVAAACGGRGIVAHAEWEPTVFNVAQCHRRLGAYAEAVRWLQAALGLRRDASTFTALGLTYQLWGRADSAIEQYHLSLGMRADDAFTVDLLRKALEDFQVAW